MYNDISYRQNIVNENSKGAYVIHDIGSFT